MQGNGVIIDIEADNLYPYQKYVWTIALKSLSGRDKLTINPFRITKSQTKQQILDFIFAYDNPYIIGHNYLGFDGWVLWKEYGINHHVGKDTLVGKPVTFFDTLYASRFLFPDREGGHSLESWGERFGFHKIDYRKVAIDLGIIQPNENEFCRWSPQMDEYCERDVDVTEMVFRQLLPSVEESNNAFRLGQKSFFLMSAQAYTGFGFDSDLGCSLVPKIEGMISDLKSEVEPDLPKRKLKNSEISLYSIPKRPFTKQGGLSATMLNFIKRHNAEVFGNNIRVNGKVFPIEPGLQVVDGLPMEIEDQNELKDYFLSIGWEPTFWNFKKDKRGKPIRDTKGNYIKTSPKIQEQGKICPNLLELDGEIPKQIVKFLSLRNRLGILTGWINDPRLKWDGRLSAGASGIAATHRQKHTTVVNVPKAEDGVLLGKEFRSLFTAEDGNVLIGVDQAALEARCEAHWTLPFDGGERAKLLLHGDIHNHNTKIFFAEDTAEFDIYAQDFDKGHPKFKPLRSLSKNAAYCLAYGGSPRKLASTLRKPENEGHKFYDMYWDANPGLKKLRDQVEKEWEANNRKFITGIDGRRLYSRSKHSLVNLLFQSTGAIIVDYSLALFDQRMGDLKLDEKGRPLYTYKGYRVKRVGYFHDEFIVETKSEIAEELSKIMEWCMVEAGNRLKLNVPLAAESKIGKTWKDTH